MQLEDKVVVVTGGGGNIGSVVAAMLAAEGAKLVVSDRAESPVAETVEKVVSEGGMAKAHEGDMLEEATAVGMVALALDTYGKIDGLVNVAGATDGVRQDADLITMEAEFWDRMMAVNVRGMVFTCKHALPSMLQAGQGSIVNFTSPAALRGDRGLFAYSASKAAVIGLTQCVATTYGRQGIRCNAVAPGCVWGDEYREKIGHDHLPRYASTRLVPRLGYPEDMAPLIAYLLSDNSSYVTAQTLAVDGGGMNYQPWVDLDH